MTHPTHTRRAAPTSQEAQADGTLILLADDHPTNRALMQRQLRLLGYAAETAKDGLEALELWKSRRFGALITDCHMPELDGYQLAKAIREAEATGSRRIPIIACTANALGDERRKCLDAGMDDCLVKPVELLALLAKLDQWVPIPAADALDPSVMIEAWGGDPLALAALLHEFQRTNDQDAAHLSAALADGDVAAVASAAHRMLGSARMLGAHPFASVCERIAESARATDLAAVGAAMPAFEAALRGLNERIRVLTGASRSAAT